MSRWLLPMAALLILAGYFGTWVAHSAAGLVVTGLDLGEFVKFLPPVRAGDIALWRPGFYAPLMAVSAACILFAYRPELAFPTWARLGLLGVATISALNLLPPAWTPMRLLEPEFHTQTGALVALLTGLVLSPLFAHLPRRLSDVVMTVLAASAAGFPVWGFFAVLPAISDLYGHPLYPAWGLWLMSAGLLLLVFVVWRPRSRPSLAN